MQTFLPFSSFTDSAQVLDMKRLGKQRVEALQIMTCLLDVPTKSGRSYAGWKNHPAVRMWRGHEIWLAGYQTAICEEWVRRGYRDTCFEKTKQLVQDAGLMQDDFIMVQPSWLGDEELHESHRSNLLRKDPAYYAPLLPITRLGLEYKWPV